MVLTENSVRPELSDGAAVRNNRARVLASSPALGAVMATVHAPEQMPRADWPPGAHSARRERALRSFPVAPADVYLLVVRTVIRRSRPGGASQQPGGSHGRKTPR
jgi:hypothetical protein